MNDPVVIAAWITSLGIVVASVLKVWSEIRILRAKQEETHALVNSRMTELLALSRRFARELGIEEGIREERKRQGKGS